MAIKFPKVRPENGEIIHPDDLLDNVGEFVNELNGSVDSDNFKDKSLVKHYSDNAFTEVYSFAQGVATLSGSFHFECPHTTTAYVKHDYKNTKLAGVEFNAETDGWAIIDFNGTFLWTGNGVTDEKMFEDLFLFYLLDESDGGGDGHLHAGAGNVGRTDMPAGGWMGFCGEKVDGLRNPNKWASYNKLLEDPSGTDMSPLKVGNFPLGQWCDVPIDFYAVQFRIVLNGTVVSESGPLFNGNWRNSVYLCGAAPVVAGQNNVDVEVRAYTAVELKTSRVGIGARDGEERRGKLFSYQERSSEVHPGTLPEYKEDSLDISDHVHKDGTKIPTGIKCDIADRLLVVQYRKR